MVARLTATSLASLLALSLTAAHAADYPMPVPVIVEPAFAGGWYLRGDIGFSNQQVDSLFNENYSRYSSVTNVDKGFDAAPIFGLGIGYNVNEWLRVDVTGEYRGRANFHGLDITQGPNYPDRYWGSKYEWTFLLNGYVDLGTWFNFTPFIGAGVGFSRNTITDFGDINEATGADAHSSTASKWNFAWALYAGVGYRVTRNLTLELAYRYISLGDAVTGTMVGYDGTTDTPFTFNNLSSHDIRLGLRFNIDGFLEPIAPLAPVYAPAPVYTAPVPPPPPVYQPGPVYQPAPGYQPAPMYPPPPSLRSRG